MEGFSGREVDDLAADAHALGRLVHDAEAAEAGFRVLHEPALLEVEQHVGPPRSPLAAQLAAQLGAAPATSASCLRCDEFCSSPDELSEARLRLYG